MASLVPSLQPTGLSIASLAALTLFKTNSRAIQDIIAPTVISERHNDTIVITDHPTEKGSVISDHAYALPKRVDIEVVYSLSGGVTALQEIGALIGTNQSPKSLKEYYKQFLDLQTGLMNGTVSPFKIETGKRSYNNMVIESIEVETDKDTENLLRLFLRCREVIIVSTTVTNNNDVQKNPATTGTPIQRGPQMISTPLPVPSPIIAQSIV